MRTPRRRSALLLLAATLVVTACGSDDTTDTAGTTTGSPTDGTTATSGGGDGEPISVVSFNFPESAILAEIYGQAMEAAGYPVTIETNAGSRETLQPELEGGAIDFLPEYVGGALSSGFGGDPTSDLDATMEALRSEYEQIGVTALEPAPGQDQDVFVTTQAFADEHGLTTISDLADAGEITFAGPPECEDRATCYAGLRDTYGLDNVRFTSVPEGSVRIAELESGNVQLILLFSTQPVIVERDFVALDDDQGITPVQNVVPVVRDEVLETHGEGLRDLVNSVSELITTDVLLDLNGKVELEAQDPEDVAREFLEANDLV